jgi:tRNA pseudouridine38-40 synthase
MCRIAALVEYCGKRFHGSQYQSGVRTVQSELERALSIFLREPVRAHFSGRTDTGVHALGQVVHFNATGGVEPESFDLWRFLWGINGILEGDMSLVAAQIVPQDFHARFSAVSREYVYRILNRPQRSALLRDTHYFIPHNLDADAMAEAAQCLLGRHDFAAFRSTRLLVSNC